MFKQIKYICIFCVFISYYGYSETSTLPQSIQTALNSKGYLIPDTQKPFLQGGESDIYKISKGDQVFVFKYPRNNDRGMQLKTAQLFRDLILLNEKGLSPKPESIIIDNKQYLIIPYTAGKTLRDETTQGLSRDKQSKLIEFYQKLTAEFPRQYVNDLHASNVMWNDTNRQWQIIDTNGIVDVYIHPMVSYRNEMCYHHSTAASEFRGDALDARCAQELNDKVVCILDRIIHEEVPQKLFGFDPFKIFCSQQGFYIQDNNEYLQYKAGKFNFVSKVDNATTFRLVPLKTDHYLIQFFDGQKQQYMMVNQRESNVLVGSSNRENWERFTIIPATRGGEFFIRNTASNRSLIRVVNQMDSVDNQGQPFKLVTADQLFAHAARSSS